MVFDPTTENQRQEFFRQNYGAHLPGYTGHCPTLKFRVGKRFGANTEDIIKESIEKKILKTGPYRPNTDKDQVLAPINSEKNTSRKNWRDETHFHKPAAPYILGYTGYIPGFNSSYGLPFMRAVEEGAKEWHELQSKLRARMETMKAQAEKANQENLLSRVRPHDAENDVDHNHERIVFDYHICPERPPIVGYTGHIPGARGEVDHSKCYAQAARKGLEFVQREREKRLSAVKNIQPVKAA